MLKLYDNHVSVCQLNLDFLSVNRTYQNDLNHVPLHIDIPKLLYNS